MYAGRTCLLDELDYPALYVLLGLQHKIAELVEHDDYLGQLLLSLFKMAVVFVYVLCSDLYPSLGVCARLGHVLEQTVAALHLLNCPVERLYRLIYIVDYLIYHEVRQFVVAYELDLLGIDEYKAQIFGTVFIQQAYEKGTQTYRFTAAGSTCYKQVRHLGDIGTDARALYVFAEGERERIGFGVCVRRGAHHRL